MVVRIRSRSVETRDLVEFETWYFYLRRLGARASGFDGSEEVFRIEDGREIVTDKAAMFSSDPYLWRSPTREEVVGALNQFRNLTALARRLGIARNTITAWKRGGPVSFLPWRFLCEVLGIEEEAIHRLELINFNYELAMDGGGVKEAHTARKGLH